VSKLKSVVTQGSACICKVNSVTARRLFVRKKLQRILMMFRALIRVLLTCALAGLGGGGGY
jgi:hypothetical protein